MAQKAESVAYFHLAGPPLAPDSIIMPGNWGRIMRTVGWNHGFAIREMALENARRRGFDHLPSRMDAAFVFLTPDEARQFRQTADGFHQHLLYRVTLSDPAAPSHVTDCRLCVPRGALRDDWANVYWLDVAAQAASIPGIDWSATTGGTQLREMLTLSRLRVEERLD
jgi:hypothetical protein